MNKRNSTSKSVFILVNIILLVVVIMVGIVFGVKKICYIENDNKMPIYNVGTNEKKISLSFDVGWGENKIEEILNVLEKHDVKATFFLVGSWIDDNEELVKLIHSKGHNIGNHSNTHANLALLSEQSIKDEIETTSQKIKDITNADTNLYRPPYGDVNKEVMEICKELGYKVIKWNIDSLDWKEIGHNHIVDRVVRNSTPGSIVLLHSNIYGVDKYTDEILTKLKNKNYEVVPVDKLIYKDNYVIDSNGVQKIKE